ncbi:phospholipase D family protein [Marinicella litoralis]|uniref:Phosphatidylserine/phosphatidylglycerophosphate/ cardiolipin synthase-like enzyme n=1 Tax=Marinicella litoralis TaxID=644220 RepID=A0A4R6XYN7_9GAMM|nr:phospholipase D family protein [Marinicella litoralis]TDR23640.1 phosphatidylserine/phosphatidylglycerophosphate/cardiolipin synthase-like enzyme [Marinicella litoralis]
MKLMNPVFCFLALLLGGCGINQETIRQVEHAVELKKDNSRTCGAEVKNRCAISTPFASYYDAAIELQKNHMLLLDHGENSLMARLNLIKAAQSTIEIQTFIWVNDEAGHLMLKELLAAAKRGVKVKVIIDQLFSMGNSWLVSDLATLHQNLEFKLYNPVFQEAHTSAFEFFSALACCMARLNKRMHNKTFIVDNKYGIVGGRNYQDRYYDWDESFNYKDRDVLAIGPVVDQMTESFASFWQSPHVVPVEHLRDVSDRILNGEQSKINWNEPPPLKAEHLLSQAKDPQVVMDTFSKDIILVDQVEYFSDTHDKPFNRDARKANKQLTQKIHQYFADAKFDILIQTPYLIFSRQARKTFKKLRRKNPNLWFRVSTNSLASTDAYYVYAISYKYKRFYLKKLDMHIYEFKDRPEMATELFSQKHVNQRTRYGMHGKSFVIDGKISMIGSHNFDPRSDVLNTESGFVIESEAFAKKLTQNIETDMKDENSWVVAAKEQIPFFSRISGVIATISRKLPIFDIWPFRYSTSYRLKPGHQEVPANHPDFYQNYEVIGSFPNVDLSSKQIQTIIISAFAGFAEPVM